MLKYLSSFIAVLDANVLFPAPIRDLLLNLACEGLYQPKWSLLSSDGVFVSFLTSLYVLRASSNGLVSYLPSDCLSM